MLTTIKDHYYRRGADDCIGCSNTNRFMAGVVKEFKEMPEES